MPTKISRCSGASFPRVCAVRCTIRAVTATGASGAAKTLRSITTFSLRTTAAIRVSTIRCCTCPTSLWTISAAWSIFAITSSTIGARITPTAAKAGASTWSPTITSPVRRLRTKARRPLSPPTDVPRTCTTRRSASITNRPIPRSTCRETSWRATGRSRGRITTGSATPGPAVKRGNCSTVRCLSTDLPKATPRPTTRNAPVRSCWHGPELRTCGMPWTNASCAMCVPARRP